MLIFGAKKNSNQKNIVFMWIPNETFFDEFQTVCCLKTKSISFRILTFLFHIFFPFFKSSLKKSSKTKLDHKPIML